MLPTVRSGGGSPGKLGGGGGEDVRPGAPPPCPWTRLASLSRHRGGSCTNDARGEGATGTARGARGVPGASRAPPDLTRRVREPPGLVTPLILTTAYVYEKNPDFISIKHYSKGVSYFI